MINIHALLTKILQFIGSTSLGTTASTITGAIAEHESDISSINTNMTDALKVVTVTYDNWVVSAYGGSYPSLTVSASGYTPVAIAGYKIENGSGKSSSDASYTYAVVGYCYLSGSTIYSYIGNWNQSSPLKLKLTFNVLCVKDELM